MSRSDYQGIHCFGNWYGSQYPAPPSSGPPTSGLKLWLKADAGITTVSGGVQSWADQSGNGNDVAAVISRPTFVASAINSQPGMTFGANQFLQNSSSSILAGSSARHAFAVCKPATGVDTFSPGGPILGIRLSGTSWYMELLSFGGATYGYSDGVANADSITSPPSITNVSCLAEISNAALGQPSYVINSISYVMSAGTVQAETGTTGFTVGNVPAWASIDYFSGTICEILVYDHVLSASDVTSVRSYVHGKYLI